MKFMWYFGVLVPENSLAGVVHLFFIRTFVVQCIDLMIR